MRPIRIIEHSDGLFTAGETLDQSGVIFVRGKVSLKGDFSRELLTMGFVVRHTAVTVAITRNASMLISSGIAGIIQG
ncbi:MAG: hypothetical protein LUO81_03460, partial [Methanoregulaceae archaeon]|nr:hypothetical protein [Methanoregulaceae archaeon]